MDQATTSPRHDRKIINSENHWLPGVANMAPRPAATQKAICNTRLPRRSGNSWNARNKTNNDMRNPSNNPLFG